MKQDEDNRESMIAISRFVLLLYNRLNLGSDEEFCIVYDNLRQYWQCEYVN